MNLTTFIFFIFSTKFFSDFFFLGKVQNILGKIRKTPVANLTFCGYKIASAACLQGKEFTNNFDMDCEKQQQGFPLLSHLANDGGFNGRLSRTGATALSLIDAWATQARKLHKATGLPIVHQTKQARSVFPRQPLGTHAGILLEHTEPKIWSARLVLFRSISEDRPAVLVLHQIRNRESLRSGSSVDVCKNVTLATVLKRFTNFVETPMDLFCLSVTRRKMEVSELQDRFWCKLYQIWKWRTRRAAVMAWTSAQERAATSNPWASLPGRVFAQIVVFGFVDRKAQSIKSQERFLE